MDLFGKLFGKKKDQSYLSAGVVLRCKLIVLLNLPDWKDNLPITFNTDETEAIDRRLSNFQEIANRELGGEAVFHPDAISEIQPMLAGEALANYAALERKFSDELPANWKCLVNTYLKAWALRPDP